MTRNKPPRVPVKTYDGVSEFGISELSGYINIFGYNFKPEYASRRTSYNILYLTSYNGLSICVGSYNARNLRIDSIQDNSNCRGNIIIDGVDTL
jgi:hypothetical protein